MEASGHFTMTTDSIRRMPNDIEESSLIEFVETSNRIITIENVYIRQTDGVTENVLNFITVWLKGPGFKSHCF